MPGDLDIRYNIGHFANPQNSSPKTQQLQNQEFQVIKGKYQEHLQKIAEDPNTQKLWNNKVLTALFLDKIPKTSLYSEEKALVQKYGFSSSTIDSMQIIHYLEAICEDPRLRPETQAALQRWIESEREYLEIALVIDGWRANNSGVMALLAGGKFDSIDQLKNIKITAPQEEIKVMAQALADHIGKMQPGQTFKMLGGYNVHEARLLIEKDKDGSFTVHLFNTANVKSSTLKYSDIKPESLNSKEFWESFLKCKLESSDMKAMEKLLKSIGSKNVLDAVDSDARKSIQHSDSCPAQAAEADLKTALVRSGITSEQGLEQYKLVKSLMAEKALELEQARVDPGLYTLLESKERVKKRYLQWCDIVRNPEKFERVKSLYQNLIVVLDPSYQFSDHHKSKVMQLRNLDNALSIKLKSASKAKLDQIADLYVQQKPEDMDPILCLKFQQKTKQVKNLVDRAFTAMPGGMIGSLRGVLPLLPPTLKKFLDPQLRFDKLDSASLRILLSDYVRVEESEKALSVIKELFARNILTTDDLIYLLEKQLETQDPVIAKGLASLLITEKIDEKLKLCCQALLDPSSMPPDKAMENLDPLLNYLSLGGHRGAATELMRKSYQTDPLSVAFAYFFSRNELVPEEWIVDVICEQKVDDKVMDALKPMRQLKVSAKDQIKLFEKYQTDNNLTNVDILRTLNFQIHIDTIKYFLGKNALTIKAAENLFDETKYTNRNLWEAELPAFVENGVIGTERAQGLFYSLPDSALKKELAAVLLKREDLKPIQKLILQAYAMPDQLLSEVAKNPELLINDRLAISVVYYLATNKHVVQLGEIATLSRNEKYFSYCLERLALDEAFHSDIKMLYQDYLNRGSMDEEKAGDCLLEIYNKSTSLELARRLYDITLEHFGHPPSGSSFDQIRKLIEA